MQTYAVCSLPFKIYQNCGETMLICAADTIVSLKKHSNLTFQPMKVCSMWVCLEVPWVDFECFYALLWRYRWLLSVFFLLLSTFSAVFGPFWVYLGTYIDLRYVFSVFYDVALFAPCSLLLRVGSPPRCSVVYLTTLYILFYGGWGTASAKK